MKFIVSQKSPEKTQKMSRHGNFFLELFLQATYQPMTTIVSTLTYIPMTDNNSYLPLIHYFIENEGFT